MRLLYSLAISIYSLGVKCAAPFNEKAALMRKGWRHWADCFPKEKLNGAKVAWFHTSSLGEFEQARPVIEQFRKLHPEYKIVLTFFSPSGFEVRKNYDQADIVIYLPPDTQRNARRLMQLMHPDIAFFVKYDFWFNYLQALQRRATPTYLFSAIFRPSQYFFKPYGKWFAQQLQCYRHIFVQNQESIKLLKGICYNRCSIAGDTRFDRVNDIALQAKSFPEIKRFLLNGSNQPLPTLIAGSSWPPDENNIKHFCDSYSKPLKLILAPHVIAESHLKQIEQLFGADNCVRYSQLILPDADPALNHRSILIIDNIGMLSSIYRYATIAYIGGGFGKGIHNTLEAAIFGCPVCFGPNYTKFQEAHQLLDCQAAKTYTKADQLTQILTTWLDDPQCYKTASDACSNYMHTNLGATATIIATIEGK
ncbi:MAG: 3-deoxy-D-manno-octulosonic acid transferase [Bacteroidales bacterium]|nr:3-deoxy-D-manno-octulosonic acid transferase [Bacteroidales bacterium]